MGARSREGPIKAKVTDVIDGIYAVTWPEEFAPKSVTFSLTDGSWIGKRPPKVKEFVILEDIGERDGGYRANKAYLS
jgi:hypothetical protein